jgi:hypothetical protein
VIIVRLAGGLGNQLFQYAAGLALARRVGGDLKVDAGGFDRDPLRAYQLGLMGINAKCASAGEVRKLLRWKGSMADRATCRVWKRGLPAPRTFFQEPRFEFSPEFRDLSDETYLQGYWQSPRYFEDVEDELRQICRAGPSPAFASSLEDDLRLSMSVSVHVRRGDYVRNPRAQAHYESCSPAYYSKAVSLVKERVANARFFVFSDEPDWAAENWSSGAPVTFMPCAPSPADDLRLMAACRHHIIANSTFSWWGAWLNPRSDKIVVSPARWFRDVERNLDDLLPAAWMRVW